MCMRLVRIVQLKQEKRSNVGECTVLTCIFEICPLKLGFGCCDAHQRRALKICFHHLRAYINSGRKPN